MSDAGYPTLPDTCDWCGETISDYESAYFVVQGRPSVGSETEAAFHDGTCYREARDYGWTG